MPALGLDLGTTSFKLIELEKDHQGFSLKHIGIAANPLGVVQVINRDQRLRLAETIKKLVSETKTKQNRIKVNLAENQSFTRIISLPVMSDAELGSAMNWEAEEHIPISLDQVQMDWSVISRPPKGSKEGKMTILLIAAKKEAISQIVGLIAETGLELIGIETTLTAAVKALLKPSDPPTLLMHIGAFSSDFAVSVGGNIMLVHSTTIAGTTLTRAVARDLGLAIPQAESYKRTYGLNGNLLEGKVKNSLLTVFQSILDEAKKVINAFESGSKGLKIDRILLSGGTALMPEIVAFTAQSLNLSEVQLADPFAGCRSEKNVIIPPERPVYTIAVGLAKSDKG